MARTLSFTVRLTGNDAAVYPSLVPEGFSPESLVAVVRQTTTDGLLPVTGTLEVYWWGKKKDGTPHQRRSSQQYSLSQGYARLLFGIALPPTILRCLPE